MAGYREHPGMPGYSGWTPLDPKEEMIWSHREMLIFQREIIFLLSHGEMKLFHREMENSRTATNESKRGEAHRHRLVCPFVRIIVGPSE